jgi:hypothetical protein
LFEYGVHNHYADFSVNKTFYSSTTNFTVNSSTITSLQDGTIFGGHIYAIQNTIKTEKLDNGYEIDNIPNSQSSNQMALSLNDRILCHPLASNTVRWLKFTCINSGIYSFSSTGDPATICQIFPSVVSDTSTSGMIAENSRGNANSGYYLDRTLTAGQTIYLRLKNPNGVSGGSSFIIMVTSGRTQHIHSYCAQPVYYSENYHKKLCRCGEYLLAPHLFDGTTRVRNGHIYVTCLECNATIDLGTTGRGVIA